MHLFQFVSYSTLTAKGAIMDSISPAHASCGRTDKTAELIESILDKLSESPQKNALFCVAKRGKKRIVAQQIGEMNPERYDYCASVLAKHTASLQEKSSSKIISLDKNAAVLDTRNKVLIIVGPEKHLGEACLLAIAIKQRLIKQKEAMPRVVSFVKQILAAA
jgi:hypothetical protein